MSQSGYGCCHLSGGVCCPVSPTTQACCPSGTTCVLTGAYSATCVPSAGGGANLSALQVCTPGARYPPSATQPSVIVIGDSVSEGYQPPLAAALADAAFVQHSPWSVGGGADDVGNGVNCEEEFLRTAMYEPAKWDLITFNFGLHNVDNSSSAEATYEALLTNFTLRLKQTGSKLLYVSTSPFMPARWFGDNAVEDMNAIAQRIMAAQGIPYADTYSQIVDYCAPDGSGKYTGCDLCDNETALWPNGPPGSFCGYHYVPKGYDLIVSYLAPIISALLG
jgi:hypothetical protein